jgi:hypothetical protein
MLNFDNDKKEEMKQAAAARKEERMKTGKTTRLTN